MKWFAGIPVLFTLVISLSAAAQPAPDKKIPVSPQVKIGKLPNGLTYYIRKNQEPKNRAELRLVVNAGSILENDKQVGLAHFTEHMSFNGTKNFKKSELVDFLEKSGVQFGADLNAYTGFDETVYQLQLPTDSPMVFKKGFQILEDWAHNVSFDDDEIDKERGVVVEEWRLGQGADERIRAKFFPVLLKGSQYANRIPIGTRENLDTFKYQTIKDFYKTWYRPDLQAVVAVGDFEVNEVEKMIKQHFAGIPKPLNPQPRKKYGIPANKETNTIIITDPEQTQNVVQILYKQTAIPQAQTDLQYRKSIVRILFNQMMTERLQEIAQKPDAPFLFASSSYDQIISDKDALTLVAAAKDGSSVAKATEALLQENERVRQNGFNQSELDRAKREALSTMENAYTEKDKTRSAPLAEELIRNFLKKEPIPGIEYEYGLYKKFLPTIKLAEVNKLITEWIKPVDRAVVITAPASEKANLITKEQVLALLNKNYGKIGSYEDKVIKASLLAKEIIPGKISSENKVNELGVTELVLSNGVKVILKPTDFQNNEIQFSAISPGGASLYNEEDYLSASNASNLTMLGGVGNFDIMSLQKELSGKQVRVFPSVSMYSEGLSGSSTPKDLETGMQLIHGYFTEPRKDSSMFKVALQQLTASLVNKGKDPGSVFSDSVSYIMSNYNLRRKPLDMSSLNKINLNKAYEVYKERFADAGDFMFTFVGNFSVDSIKPLLEKYIASLPSTGTKETWKDVGLRYPQGTINKEIKKGQENKASVRLTFTGMGEYSNLEDTKLDQLSKVLSIRLREVLREDQGGVYGVGVSGGINRQPVGSYAITVSFGCSKENVEKLIGLTIKEIKELQANGAPQSNIDKVVAEDVRALETQVKENSYWLANLEQKYYYKEDPKIILDDPAMVKKFTVERSKEMANKYFNFDNLARLVLVPEK